MFNLESVKEINQHFWRIIKPIPLCFKTTPLVIWKILGFEKKKSLPLLSDRDLRGDRSPQAVPGLAVWAIYEINPFTWRFPAISFGLPCEGNSPQKKALKTKRSLLLFRKTWTKQLSFLAACDLSMGRTAAPQQVVALRWNWNVCPTKELRINSWYPPVV